MTPKDPKTGQYTTVPAVVSTEGGNQPLVKAPVLPKPVPTPGTVPFGTSHT